MKSIKFLAILLILFSSKDVFSQNKPKLLNKPKVYFKKVKFLNTNINFDNFEAKKPCVGMVMFINVSKQPLVIKETTQDCGCFTVDIESKTVQPGEKGILKYTISSPSIGNFNKKSFIFFEGINTPVPITITGIFINKRA